MCERCNVLADIGEALSELLNGHQTHRELQLFAQRVAAILEVSGDIPHGGLKQVLEASAK